jgi:hypothetical protein
MKFSTLAIAALTVAALGCGPALAQATPPVTMQPIANPPEKPKAPAHHAKHHKKSAAPATSTK